MFENIRGAIKENHNLASLTWFKVGGSADLYFKPKDVDDLKNFLTQYSGPVTVLGAGSNIIIRDKGIEGAVIKLVKNFTEISLDQERLVVGAGCLNYNLSRFAQVNGIAGFEFLVGIPGCIGGGVVMNAGSYGREFKDIVDKIHVIDLEGKERVVMAEDLGFGYRKSNLEPGLIITKVEFKISAHDSPQIIKERMDEISNLRSQTQPITEKTGGSTFANPENHKAWALIDEAGMRGAKIGGASMSEKHCNFMINDGTATAQDIEDLGELVIEKVFAKSGIKLKWEIRRVGRK